MGLAHILTAPHRDWLEVSDFEAGVAVTQEPLRTFSVLRHLKAVMPEGQFTFVMGADNWADAQTGFHTWQNFEHILGLASILILPRHPWTEKIPNCTASLILAAQRDPASQGPVTARCWRLMESFTGSAITSTEIRQDLQITGTTAHLTAEQLG